MKLKTFRIAHLGSRLRMRRTPSARPAGVVREPRVWSLLLPPQYPADRR